MYCTIKWPRRSLNSAANSRTSRRSVRYSRQSLKNDSALSPRPPDYNGHWNCTSEPALLSLHISLLVFRWLPQYIMDTLIEEYRLEETGWLKRPWTLTISSLSHTTSGSSMMLTIWTRVSVYSSGSWMSSATAHVGTVVESSCYFGQRGSRAPRAPRYLLYACETLPTPQEESRWGYTSSYDC